MYLSAKAGLLTDIAFEGAGECARSGTSHTCSLRILVWRIFLLIDLSAGAAAIFGFRVCLADVKELSTVNFADLLRILGATFTVKLPMAAGNAPENLKLC